MGVDQLGWGWRCFFVLVRIVAVGMTVGAFNSHKKREQLVSRIAFGSCSNQTAPQPIWDAVVDFRPQIFISLGDNIYGDIRRPFKLFGLERTIGPWKNAPPYVPSFEQEMEARYQKAKSIPGYARLKENAEVIGTWDDHDYGLNDAGKEFHGKITNQRLLLDFLDEPQDSPRRKQAGVYASYTYGPVGRDIKRRGVFISGDIHFGEITKHDCALDYPLYDLTSSGLTQSIEGIVSPHLRFIVRFMAWFNPSTMRVKDPNCRYSSCIYGQPNFGTIEIDWESQPVSLKFKVRDKNGVAVTGINISLLELHVSNSESGERVKVGYNQKHCTLEVSLPWIIRYRLAVLFYFTIVVLLLGFLGLVYGSLAVLRQGVCKRKRD